jgi:orotidine-5'-phosphate decarboxylase
MQHFADRLLEGIERKGSCICVGIDPVYEMLPDAVAGPVDQRNGNDVDACVDAIYEFTTGVLQVIQPHVQCVKFQSAYFEKYLWEGVEAYYELIHEAREMGFIVIGDVKRGDIGSTSEAYASAHLAEIELSGVEESATPDAITVNAFLGMDSIQPFINVARATGKGLFVLVRTSNPGSADLQDAQSIDGRTFSELIAEKLAVVAASDGVVGQSGWSSIGAVVGATQPHTMTSLRQRLPKSIFLLPGYGTQGATAEMTKAAFRDGKGAIVSASRSILYAHQKQPEKSWEDAVLTAVRNMQQDLASMQS